MTSQPSTTRPGTSQPGATLRSDVIPPGAPWSAIIRRGQVLRIVDTEGRQGVDFLCYSAANPEERYHAANTIKRAGTLRLTSGHVLYSDVARPMMTVVGDSCGYHDTIAGCCSAQGNEIMYGVKNMPGCRENFLAELAKFGLGRKDVVANLNFFCDVPVGAANALAPTIFETAPSKAGDFVELRAEMDVIAVISNCPQVNNPCSGGRPTAIEAIVRAG
jgi:urea carboxylase-associated protein 1